MEKTIVASLPEIPFKGSFKILVSIIVLHPSANVDDPIDSRGDSSDSEGAVGFVDVSEVHPIIFDGRELDGVHSKLLCDIYPAKETNMCSQNQAKTLREEIAEAKAAEQRAATVLSEALRREEAKLSEAAWAADTLRADEIIATIREKVLAPDRANWKSLMILTESQVFVPGTHNDNDILLRDGAAKLVRDYCRDNGIEVKVSAERRDGQYSISSATGNYIMSIRVK
jgi:hypothetical protein